MYYTLRIDADPTSWELTNGVEQVPQSGAPAVLPVYHPLLGHLVLSPQAVGSTVLLEYKLPPEGDGTRPNGGPIWEPALYLPSPIGPNPGGVPPNLYTPLVDLAVLQADIIAAMTKGTFLTVNVRGGEVVINGARLPFAVLCPRNQA